MSERGATRRAKQHQWPSQMVAGKGGKGGVKTEYMIPQEVRTIVHSFLNENPDFFSKDKTNEDEPKAAKHYQKSDKATALTLKAPEARFKSGDFDPVLFYRVVEAVELMLEKHHRKIAPRKKVELFFLLHDYCLASGDLNDAIVERYIQLAG
jgi:hypothetical protein